MTSSVTTTAVVTMLDVGTLTAPAGLIRRGESFRTPLRFPVPAYLIETAGRRILVDTGLHPDAVRDVVAHYGPSPAAEHFAFAQAQSIAERVDLDRLDMVVLTHLHWDHVGGLALVPGHVPVVLQRVEWEAGHDEAEIQANGFCPRDYDGTDRPFVLVDGDHDLLGDGTIELLWTPGHTPGHQSVRVGNIIIGGDVTHFASGLDDRRFPVFGADLEEQGRSADRLRTLRDAGATILPGHDPDVLRPGRVEA